MFWATVSLSQQGTASGLTFRLEVVGEKAPILHTVAFCLAGEEVTSCYTDIQKLFLGTYEVWFYLQCIEMHLLSFIGWFYNSHCLLFIVIGCFLQRWLCFRVEPMYLSSPHYFAHAVSLCPHFMKISDSLPQDWTLQTAFLKDAKVSVVS